MDLFAIILAIIGTTAGVIQTWIVLKQYLHHSESSAQPIHKKFGKKQSILASVIVTILLMGVVRPVGLLQHSELQAFDWMMRLRPDLGQDDRLLVVEVTEADLKYQDEQGWKRQGSLSDTALVQLLEKLELYQPPAIGLDIYRDFSAQKDLVPKLKQNPNFFAVCKVSELKSGDIGVSPPPEIPVERLGFADVVEDSDGVLRRYLWYMDYSDDSPCKARIAFSLQLAGHYLKEAKRIKVKPIPELEQLQVGNICLRPLAIPMGGYQKFKNLGYQMLLNYRTRGNIAQRVTLREMLNDEFDRSWVKDRIILIGVTAESVKDDFITPFSRAPDQKMRGVLVQGQMISQVLSAVLDGRPLLQVWSQWGEVLWVGAWALAGGWLAWYYRRQYYLILVLVIILSVTCFVLFVWGWWLPFVPSALALVATGGTVIAYRIYYNSPSINSHS